MLESYITPLLMGYVNKYIRNLKPSDLSLSVWGGDVVLQNLELNLEVLQQELNLPVKFLSGRIHELRINVPWTRITYEPVTITINTIEFVVKLRDPDEGKVAEGSNEADKAKAKEFKKEMQKAKIAREAEHLPPGYVQGVMNKVVNNISVCVNNLIVKYVEDDIVFSLNVKSASLFSANESWEKAFVELKLPGLCLRKMCNISDLTICLDSRNADGKIEMYQDPILYKCNLSCRILSKYKGLGSVSAFENQVNVYCESLDISSTDVQLPMIIRLLKLCLGLYYRTLDLPGCNHKHHPAEGILEERKHLQENVVKSSNIAKIDPDVSLDDASWVSWAWSMLPNIADEGTSTNSQMHYDLETILSFGVFITQCSLTLKLTDEAHDSSIVGSKRFEFSPVLNIEMSGCAIEIISKGEEYFDCQFGVSNIVGYLIGNCICKKGGDDILNVRSDASIDFEELEKESEDELFFEIGSPKDTAENGLGFLEDSLFRQPNGHKNDDKDGSLIYERTVLPEKGKQFNEGKVTKKFGALFFDYFYVMELPKDEENDSEKSESKPGQNMALGSVMETSLKRIILGPCNGYFTSRLHHLLTKVMEFCADDTPSRKMKDAIFIDQFVTNQLQLGNLPTRGLHLTCTSLNLTVCYPDHIVGKSGDGNNSEKMNEQCNLHGVLLQIERVDYKVTSPMYPDELNFLLENETKPKAMFYRAAYSNFFAKVFGMQIGLCQHGSEYSEPTILNIVPLMHGSVYAKVFIGRRTMVNTAKLELRANSPNLTLNFTKAQFLMLTGLSKSWIQQNPSTFNQVLIDDIFHPKADRDNLSSMLEVSLADIEVKYVLTESIYAVLGSLGNIKVFLESLHNGAVTKTAVMYGPLNTSSLSNIQTFMDDSRKEIQDMPDTTLISFKAQMPVHVPQGQKHKSAALIVLDVKGIALNIVQPLLRLFEYKPSSIPRKRTRGIEKRPSRILSRSISASTPKKKSYSRLFGKSPSKASKEHHSEKTLEERQPSLGLETDKESHISYAMAILKSLILKVDLEALIIFLPVDSWPNGKTPATSGCNIPLEVKNSCRNCLDDFPDTLVVTLPSLKLNSSNLKSVDLSSDIPIEVKLEDAVDCSLPWALNGEGFSVYVLAAETLRLRPDFEGCYIWYPAPWTMFLAAAHANPKTPECPKSPFLFLQDSLTMVGVKPVAKRSHPAYESTTTDNQPSLGFCIHIDLASVSIGVSRKQVEVILKLVSQFKKTFDNFNTSKKIEVASKLFKDDFSHNEARSDINIDKNADHRSISTTSTADQQDALSISTEMSLSNSPRTVEVKETFVVSLWLQWIIPKMSITLYGEPSLDDTQHWYKIPLMLEDLSFAFDYQNSEIQMTSKVGSISVKNYKLRSENNEWICGNFDGILISCDDIIESSMDALPSVWKSSLGSFLTMTYTRRPLPEINSRTNSVRSEAAVVDLDVDEASSRANEKSQKYFINDDVSCQHKLNATMQPVDIVLILEPILNVVDSFLALETFTGPAASLRYSHMPLSDECHKEGIFQPLPQLDFESKGFRILIPLHDAKLDRESNSSTLHENIVLFRVRSIVVKPDPVNRISSTVLQKEWYRHLRKHQREKGRRTKSWHLQYQLDLSGISLWSSRWNDLKAKKQLSEEDLGLNADGQNPALEWNYKIQTEREPVKMSPILREFNCRSIVSPAIQITRKVTNQTLAICSNSMEIHFPKEIVAHCNPNQVNLLWNIAVQISSLSRNLGKVRTRNNTTSKLEIAKGPEMLDSGVSSVISLKGTNTIKSTQEQGGPILGKNTNEDTQSAVELFASINKISFALHILEHSNDDSFLDGNDIYKPIVYFELVQPTLNISSIGVEKSLQLTVYDSTMALGHVPKTLNTLPDKSSFEMKFFRTSKGNRNKKTGLFPSAFVVTISKKSTSDVGINIDRPLQIDFNLGMNDIINQFLIELQLCSGHLSNDEFEEGAPAKMQNNKSNHSTDIANVEIQTNRISVTAVASSQDHELSTVLRSMNVAFDIRSGLEDLKACTFKCDVNGFEINLSHHRKQLCLLSPCIFEFNGEAELMRQNKSDTPRLILAFKSGLIRVQISQLHLDCLNQLIASFQEKAAPDERTDEAPSETKTVALHAFVEYSKDDLRTGIFEYVTHSGEEGSRPLANQIVFSGDDAERPPTMAWRYPMPRFLNEVTVLPLPFHVDEMMFEDESAEIPCVIRYWDHLEQTYVTYRHFFLSQNKTDTLSFPDPLLDTMGTCQVASEEFQVVVDVAIESETGERSEPDDIPEDILKEVTAVYKTPVSAASLAACIKVDSCYVPAKIPYLLCSASIGCFQIVLANHFDPVENGPSRMFAPFFLDSYTYPSNQEACCFELTSFLCKSSLMAGGNPVQKFDVDFDATLAVMNYNDLSWRECFKLTSFAAELTFESDPRTDDQATDLTKSKIDAHVNTVKIIASQFVVHTLSLTADNWTRNQSKGLPLLNHYVICNETEDILRFGQVDTDEDIVLASGQMYPYSWRSPHNQALHLCVDSVGDWKWSAPFDIDSIKGCSRTIKHNTHSSLIHIQIKKVGGIQKQIIFRGGLTFRNCLKKDVEFELVLHHVELIGHLKQQKISQVTKNFVVPAETTRPSLSFSPSTVTSIYVRLLNDQRQSGWSVPLNLALENEQDLHLPLTLSSKNEPINVWYCVSQIISDRCDQFEVCICPMFIIRNHLSWPVVMTAKSRDSELCIKLNSKGRGKEAEVFNLSPNTWYNTNFQLEGTNECTDPPVPINTTFIDILKKKNKIDLQNINYESEWPYGDGCSITEEQPPRILPQRSPSPEAEMSSPDLQCQLLQRWPTLPSIVIEIRPKFIIGNYSEQNLVIRDAETHLIWELEKNGILTSPAIQHTIQFGRVFMVGDSEVTEWSSEIHLLEKLEGRSRSSFVAHKSEELPPHSSSSFTIFQPEGNSCFQFSISSKIRNGIVIIRISDRFRIHNFTGITMKCFPCLCEEENLTMLGDNKVDIHASAEPVNIDRVSLIQQPKNSDATAEIPNRDLSAFSIRFYFLSHEASPPLNLGNEHAFDLSCDHLRENIMLRGPSRQPLCVALTSYLKDGTINIYLDEEPCPSFNFSNTTQVKLVVRTSLSEKESDKKQQQVGSGIEWDSVIDIGPMEEFSYQSKAFRNKFPVIGGVIDGHLKVLLEERGSAESCSNEFTFNDTEGRFEMIIESKRILISYQKSANCFFVLFSEEVEASFSVIKPMNIPVTFAGVGKINVMVLDDETCEEVCSISIDNVVLQHKLTTSPSNSRNCNESKFFIDVGALQIDNQSTDDYGHFPVVFLPLREVSQRYKGESPHNAPFSDTHACTANALFRTVITTHNSGSLSGFIDNMTFHAEPLEIYFEDTFIYRLIGLIDSFSPPQESVETARSDTQLLGLRSVGRQILTPINIGSIEIEDLRVLLSIHASVKMYLAADHMPIVLGKFKCHPARTLQKELMRRILYHYATQALVRAGLMLGSLEILANPTGLFRSIGKGVSDFFTLPYDGLTRGPSAFVSGIGSGMGSFVRHTSVGALTSITNFASSLSRNLDRLSLDEEHMVRQEEQRCRTSLQVWPGFANAFSGFGISLLGAVAGIVDHPINNIQNADNTRDAIKGAAKGLGKGLVGIVAKPIGGAMELLSQTGQGILLGTGLTKPPKKVKSALMKQEIKDLDKDSFIKYSWKVLRVEFEEYANLFVTTDVHVSSESDVHGYDGTVILTPSALYLYDRESSNIRMAFSCNEIDLRLDKESPHLIYIEKRDKQPEITYGYDELTKVDEIRRESSPDPGKEPTNSRSFPTNSSYPFLVQMNPRYSGLLYSQFAYQKDLVEEKMSDEIELLDIAVFKQ